MSDLIPEWRVGSVVLTDAPFLVPFGGVDYGTPENVTELIRSVLSDGDIEISDRAGNRTVTLPVLIEDSDLAALAEAEALLEGECRKVRNEVYVDPGDGFAEPFYFDVFRGQLSFERNDDYESAGYRSYTLTFRALPFSRGATPQLITPTPTTFGTARQKSYEFDVAGSARTEASLRVVGGSGGLGPTLIYTRPGAASGMIPLRQHKVIGPSATTDSTRVSGAYEGDITTAFGALVPKTDVPDGTYILLSLVRSASGSGTTTLSAEVTTRAGLTNVRAATQLSSPVSLTTAYSLVQVGTAFQLPSAVLGSEASIDIGVELSDAGGGLTVRHDESWLVEIGSGTLTWPVTDVSPPSERIWIDAPSVDQPYRRVLQGTDSLLADAYGADTFSRGIHKMEPGENFGFLVTGTDVAGALTAEVWPRFHTHAVAT